jgi:hypothetical protein
MVLSELRMPTNAVCRDCVVPCRSGHEVAHPFVPNVAEALQRIVKADDLNRSHAYCQ